MHLSGRRVAAAVAAAVLLVLVACDLWVGAVRTWGDGHALTSSVVANLLVLAVAALIVDEVVARRQRRERSVSVAIQALIVYGQVRRSYGAIVATDDDRHPGDPTEELRTLAGMLLTASPSLFDDPAARRFLEQVERFSVTMFRTVAQAADTGVDSDRRRQLQSELADVLALMQPLLARIPEADRPLLEGPSDG